MSNSKRCVVTGLGLVCGIGNNVSEFWKNASNGVSGIDEVKAFDTSNCYSHSGAEVKLSNDELPGEGFDRSVRLCLKAANEAIEDSKITNSASKDEIVVILGSCVGGAASIDKYFSADINSSNADSKDIFNMSASSIANDVAYALGFGGITANIVNACAAGTMSISYACDLIRAGKADVFLTGGTDSFSSLAFSGFHALHALDENHCSPFNHSSGITLGEGAAVLVVESYEHAVKRGAHIYCEILGSGVSADAYHITAPRPDGKLQMYTINKAIKNSGLSENDIDYINAHGTGTAKNDEAEFLSLHTLFPENDHLSVSSTKSMTGHCLGAAGSIEAVLIVKSICDGIVPPTIGYSDDDLENLKEKAGKIDFVPNNGHKKDVHYAMSNSFAFGGNNASIIFSSDVKEIPDHSNNEKIYVTGIGSMIGTSETEYRVPLKKEDYQKNGIKMAFYRKLDNFSRLQLISGVQAVSDAKITVNDDNATDIGIVIGTSDGPMTEISNFQINEIKNGLEKGSAFSFPNTVYNAAGGYLSIFTGIEGYNATIANGSQAGLQSLAYACDVIHKGDAKIMLAAGTDENTDTDKLLYSRTNQIADNDIYSLDSNGFKLGEGSVSLVLESESSVNSRNAEIYAEVAGCGCAHAPVRYGEFEGCVNAVEIAIKKALENAGVALSEIDAISGFANGSKSNDEIEVSAYRKLFENGITVFNVKKTYGEARSATASMQAAFACQILSGNTENQLNAYNISENDIKQIKTEVSGYKNILAVSCSTGGSCTAVVFRKAR